MTLKGATSRRIARAPGLGSRLGVETAADVVVTMGCVEQVPVSGPPRCYVDWDVPDPAGQDLARVREIRDEINRRVQELLADLEPERPRA